MNEHIEVDDAADLAAIEALARSLPPAPTRASEAHSRMMLMVESIHDEIRQTHKDFMPLYDPAQDSEAQYDLTKYVAHEYSMGSHYRAD